MSFPPLALSGSNDREKALAKPASGTARIAKISTNYRDARQD
jgi:hypothetical protein